LAQPAEQIAELADRVGDPGRPCVVQRDRRRTGIARFSRGYRPPVGLRKESVVSHRVVR
jgi:hypothetical protein